MNRRFRGEYTFKVDAKGRVSIPAPFRRIIEAGDPDYTEGLRPQFVLVYGPETQNFLEGYTIEEMQKLEDKIERLPHSDLRRRLVYEKITCSQHAEIDPDGRLVLSSALRDELGLQPEAKIVGSMNTFRIFSPEAYEETKGATSKSPGFGLPDDMDSLDALDRVLDQRGMN